ncbi:pilus assembly protein N-terminal domain-containing protein [Zhongshania sp.]|jgi:pilus assembly protein CpaC|uniref:pilus assembly protein N-terminal domain-containing protein n=1 Tax=Zhongshania sp. TaxID=1971902 RepID=UPI001B4A65F4|nr:pilus assembly protein N-terminal domain-containing protein [Zhongshania sp.]MBQ0794642.1 pilus assembly protein N-terminal domain-containing protein [Zhongshania sp.]
MSKERVLQFFIKIPAIFGLCLLLFPALGYADYPSNMPIEVGEVRTLQINGLTHVAIGDPSKVGYKTLENGELMIVGLEPGESSMQIWRNGGRKLLYKLKVQNRYVSESVRMARALTAKISGLKVYSMDSRLVVEGKINKNNMASIEAVRALTPDAIFILEERPFKRNPIIRVDAVLVEINDNDVQKLGIEWDTATSGPIYGFHKDITPGRFRIFQEDPDGTNEGIINAIPFGDSSFFQYFGITSHLASTLNFLQSSGQARILSAPKLTAVSGESASFHIGGQFPIPVINALGATTVERQDYGVILQVSPTIDDGIINMEVTVDLSDIDPSVTVNGVPGTRNRKTQTVVQLEANQTVAISGLFATADSEATSGIPGLSKIPILKYLFGVEDKDSDNKQVVVLLTPKLISPGDETDRALSSFATEMLRENQAHITVDAALME